MHRSRTTRPNRRTLTAVAAAAALLAACTGGDDTPDPQEDEAAGAVEEPQDLEGLEDLEGFDEDPLADMEDPNDLVVDGRLAANGVIVPAPDGWQFDAFAFAQGVAVTAAPEGLAQIAAQAVDPAMLGEDVSFDDLVEQTRESVPAEPALDREFDMPGAVRAVELRFLDLPFEQGEIDDDISEVSLLAERADGVLALFNYTAVSAEFDDQIAELLLEVAALDPDSDPAAPAPAPAP